MIVSSGIRACSFFSEQGTVRVRFLHSSLHILCFDICIDWQEEKQMTRLNSLHPSLGAWKDSTLCILPLGPEKNKKKKTTTLCLRHSGPVGLLGFLGFLVFFFFLFFLFFLLFFVSFGFPAFPQINFFLRTSLCLFPHVGMKEPFVNNKKNLKRDLSELKIKIISFFWGWLGWKPFFLNLLNSKA